MDTSELAARLRSVLAGREGLRFALLFGSSVVRGPDAANDVDVAISSSSRMSLMERAALATDLEQVAGKRVDVVDIHEASTLLQWEIVCACVVISARDEDALHELRARVPLEYADLRPYLDREAEGLRRALATR